MVNEYVEELMKFNGKEVVVTDTDGREHEGVCCGINHQHLNVVLRTEDEKIVIKHVLTISRKRSNPEN